MRIAVLPLPNTEILQYIAKDMADALRYLGHDVLPLELPYVGFQHDPMRWLCKRLDDTAPDWCLSVGLARHELRWVSEDVPIVSWFIDEIERQGTPEAVEAVGPKDVVYSGFDEITRYLVASGYQGVRSLRPGYSHFVYHEEPTPKRKAVSLITNINPPTDGMLANLSEERVKHFTERFALIHGVATALQKAGIETHIWGRKWELFPQFWDSWHGVAIPGPELRAAYNSCAVTINCAPSGHMREMEASACGCLCLSRADGNPTALVPDVNVNERWESPAELVELVRDKLRGGLRCASEVARSNEEHAKQIHTWVHRMRRMIENMEEGI